MIWFDLNSPLHEIFFATWDDEKYSQVNVYRFLVVAGNPNYSNMKLCQCSVCIGEAGATTLMDHEAPEWDQSNITTGAFNVYNLNIVLTVLLNGAGIKLLHNTFALNTHFENERFNNER